MSPQGGSWNSKTSPTPLQLQCASIVELCSVSINCQVRSFCNYSSIPPYLNDSSIFPSFVRLSLLNFFFLPSHLFSLPFQYFLILLLQHLLISSTLGIITDEQKLRPPPSSFPCCAQPRSLRWMPKFALQQWVHLPHLPT